MESRDPGITSTDDGFNVFIETLLYQSPARVMSNGVFIAPVAGLYLVSS
ncbi:hypothetical protein [Chryseobacterium sp.]|nr:hypothetical protein [Chryseobacterium sp.]